MNTASRLRVCNRALGITLLLTLASGIQLEATGGRFTWSVWVHILLGIVLTILSAYHIFLHYRFSNWFSRFAKNRNKGTRIFWWVFLLTVATGVAATVIWLVDGGHTPLGGIHGKIGFLMVLVGIIHAAGHIRKRKKGRRP